MSTQELKHRVTGGAVAGQPKDLAHLMSSPAVQAQIKAALPRHMTPERMARIATTEMRKIPKLAECNPMSFLGAVIQCSQLGLEPGGSLGHVYLIPFGKEVQVIVGYRGMIDLARRSGQLISIDARAVYEGDTFECILGLESKLNHTPDWTNPNRADPAKLRFVYAVAKLKDGGTQFDVMSKVEVDAIRKRSKSSSSGPWVTDYAAMALKTVVRRLFKYLPVSIELQHAVGIDEMADAGISQQNSAILDGQFTEVDSPAELAAEMRAEAETTEAANPTKGGSPASDDSAYTAMFNRIKACADTEVLDLVCDEIRDVFGSNDQAKLFALATERRTELTGA
jgi:recombination protein RecT